MESPCLGCLLRLNSSQPSLPLIWDCHLHVISSPFGYRDSWKAFLFMFSKLVSCEAFGSTNGSPCIFTANWNIRSLRTTSSAIRTVLGPPSLWVQYKFHGVWNAPDVFLSYMYILPGAPGALCLMALYNWLQAGTLGQQLK